MKAILGIVALLIVIVVGYLGLNYYRAQQVLNGPATEIASESITRTGDTWHLSFVSRFDAPVDKVYQAFTEPEKIHDVMPDNILKSDLVSSDGNTKVVDAVGRSDILPPGFKVQNLRTEWHFSPEQKTIASNSVDFKLADLKATFKFEPTPDGKGTVLRFDQTSKDKAPLIVESLQKAALKETYLWQVRAANKKLGLAPAPVEAKRAEE